MAGALAWVPTGPVVSADPYGQWATCSGHDFLVDYRRSRQGDRHHYYVALRPPADPARRRAAEDPWLETADGILEPTLVDRHTLWGRDGLPRPTRRPVPGEHVFPVPLPSDSVPRSGRPAAGEPEWSAPDGLKDAGSPVIVGVIDDGIAFCNERFRLAGGGSRVDFAWIQDARYRDAPGLPFGHEFTRPQIERQLRRATDEDDLLRAFDLADLLRAQQPTAFRRASHGTAVLDLAAGYPPAASAVDKRIVTVQLPGLANWDGSGAGLGWFVAWGVSYILSRARLIARRTYGEAAPERSIPVIINLSYGLSGGPHDGTHVFEQMVGRLLRRYRDDVPPGAPKRVATLVVPGGNDFLTRRHASVAAPAGGAATLTVPWRIGPGDRTSSFLEVWLPKDARDVGVEVVPPRGPSLGPWQPPLADPAGGEAQELVVDPGAGSAPEHREVVARASMDAPPWSDGRWRFVLVIAPTDTDLLDRPRPPAPTGVWTVTVTATLGAGERIEAWMQREELPFGYPPRGGPCYLDDPANARFTPAGDLAETDSEGAVVTRLGTLNGFATGADGIVVGAYRDNDRRPALYAASAAPGMRRPDAMLPADASRPLPGVLVSGNRSGATFTFAGTSAAAPQATRLLAENVADVAADGAAAVIGALAQEGEAVIGAAPPWSPPLPPVPGGDPSLRRGAGRILAPAAIGRAVSRGRWTV